MASAVAQNALRASFPATDASSTKVIDYYAGHHGITVVLAVLFPLGAIGITLFAASLWSQLGSGPARRPALAGMLGLVGIVSAFTMTVAADLALAGYVHSGGPDRSVVSAMWMIHNATFGLLGIWIGLALAGLSFAAAQQGMIGSAWRPLGLVGGLSLAVSAAITPAMLDNGKLMSVGLIGFLLWLVFVAVSSVKLLRGVA
ncbi:MAG: hypothetical protein ACXVLM_11895 [Ilumatobacteraceae bacterium]